MMINPFLWIFISLNLSFVFCSNVIKETCEGGYFYSKRTLRCLPCPRGRFGNLGACITCPPGKYNPSQGSEGALECQSCPPGTYTISHGSLQCESVCPTGKYSTKWGASSEEDCKDCPDGLASFQCGFDTEPDVRTHNSAIFESFNFVDQYYRKRTPTKQELVKSNKCGGLNNVCMTRHIQ